MGSLSLPNRASADAYSFGLNYLKRVQLAFLIVPVMNQAASFDSSARISCLLRFFLSSEGCCVTSVNVPTPQTMAGSVVARKRNVECRTKVKTGCKTCRSVIADRSHHRSTPQDCEFRREVSSAMIMLNIAIELGRSNATRISRFAKNVSTLVVLAMATSPPLDFLPVNPSTMLMLAASSQTLVYNPSGPPSLRSPLRTSTFSIVTSQPKPCST